MGLFDDVVCEYPLPDWPVGETPLFQTKDLECEMRGYRITKEGRLLAAEYEPAGGRAPARWVDTGHHGYLTFYTSLARAGNGEWFHWRAKFTDGSIVDLQRVRG